LAKTNLIVPSLGIVGVIGQSFDGNPLHLESTLFFVLFFLLHFFEITAKSEEKKKVQEGFTRVP